MLRITHLLKSFAGVRAPRMTVQVLLGAAALAALVACWAVALRLAR